MLLSEIQKQIQHMAERSGSSYIAIDIGISNSSDKPVEITTWWSKEGVNVHHPSIESALAHLNMLTGGPVDSSIEDDDLSKEGFGVATHVKKLKNIKE